jgi:hypothetical protein
MLKRGRWGGREGRLKIRKCEMAIEEIGTTIRVFCISRNIHSLFSVGDLVGFGPDPDPTSNDNAGPVWIRSKTGSGSILVNLSAN